MLADSSWRAASTGVAAGSSTTTSAQRPGSSDPIRSSRPSRRALPRVARWNSSCAAGRYPRSIATLYASPMVRSIE